MTGASGAHHPELVFLHASAEDADTISNLAREIWTEVYTQMIGRAQIDYMLDWMYAPETLRREIAKEGISYVFIERADEPVGYLAFAQAGSRVDLNKLYLRAALHGCGIGTAALAWLAGRCRGLGATSIQLRVNKNNAAAIRAYERNGYLRVGALCENIGGGFVMDDYVYSLRLTGGGGDQ